MIEDKVYINILCLFVFISKFQYQNIGNKWRAY